jgi:hypothetical protein
MAGNIHDLFTTLTGVKQDFKTNFKEDAKSDWKVDWAHSPIVSGPVPVASAAPVISGSLTHPAVLTATSPGTWSNTPTSYTYQWYNSYSGALPGATASTYTLQASDVGQNIAVHVTAHNAAGASTPAVSNVLGPIV